MSSREEQRKLMGITPSERGAVCCTGAARPPQAPGDSAVNPRTEDMPWLKQGAFLRPLFENAVVEQFKKGEYWVQKFGDGDLWFYPMSTLKNGSTKGLLSSYGKKPVNSTVTRTDVRLWTKGQSPDSKIIAKFHKHAKFESHEAGDILVEGKETFKAAKARLLEYLQSQGWKVKQNLKIPRADTYYKGYNTTLWFKPQAIYVGQSNVGNPSFNHARSMHTEIRGMSGEDFIKDFEKWVNEDLDEKSPPGWEKTVKAMKKHPEIANPWALAWSMKNKGYKSRKADEGTDFGSALESKQTVLASLRKALG